MKINLQFFALEEDDKLKAGQAASAQTAQTNAAQSAAQKPAAPTFQNTYGNQMSDLYNQMSSRDPFQYNVDEDALYQQYKDKYVTQGKNAMRDTMGQAAALTGGYGSTYSQQVGQQTYDSYLQDLNNVIPDLYNSALNQYNQEGQNLKDQYGILADLNQTEYGQYSDALNQYNYQQQQDYAHQQDSLAQLQNLILTAGYQATPEDLQAAGMTQEQADALYTRWINTDPLAAFNAGVIDANRFFAITGTYPPSAQPARRGGGGDGMTAVEYVDQSMQNGYDSNKTLGNLRNAYAQHGITDAEYLEAVKRLEGYLT